MKVPPGTAFESFNSALLIAAIKLEFVKHLEGSTKLLVPSLSLTLDPPPTSPVFFNPAASLNRDISVAITAATGGSDFCDSMSGIGARGLRVANEVDRVVRVVMVDFNTEALKAARRGAKLNGVERKCEFSSSETTSYLCSRFGNDERFDYVDVDPFGTPVRQLQAALSAVSDGGIVSITATDTAVLCGVYPRVSRRRYGAASLKNHFSHESGLRILAGALARQGAQIDVGVSSVFAHSTRHYLRLFMRVCVGASNADRALANLGYLSWCPSCGHTSASAEGQKRCPDCEGSARVAGPMWIRGLVDPKAAKGALGAARKMNFDSAVKIIGSVEGLDEFPPWSFSIEGASSSMKVATVPESQVRQALVENGWRVMRTPFEKTGIKTDASFREFMKAAERSNQFSANTTKGGHQL
jgi:tRNA (guanine26-N2/guanine27-N2)-dimethyltransferase